MRQQLSSRQTTSFYPTSIFSLFSISIFRIEALSGYPLYRHLSSDRGPLHGADLAVGHTATGQMDRAAIVPQEQLVF
jgi:hypothetical protein